MFGSDIALVLGIIDCLAHKDISSIVRPIVTSPEIFEGGVQRQGYYLIKVSKSGLGFELLFRFWAST